jgi:hypothetical protein
MTITPPDANPLTLALLVLFGLVLFGWTMFLPGGPPMPLG